MIFATPVYAQVPFNLIISEQLRSTFTLVGSGARAAGMGGAFTAVADDATAASFNPAGLAQLVVPEASVVFDHLDLQDQYLDFVVLDPVEAPLPLSDSEAQFDRNSLNFLSFSLPFAVGDRRWAAQFSTQKAVDLTYHGDRLFSEIDSEGNPVVDIQQVTDQSGGIRIYSGSLAISATRRMLIGVAINHWKGDWDSSSFTSETIVEDPEDVEFLSFTQTNALSAWNFDLGMLLQYKYANVGIRYRSGFSADYTLKVRVDTNIEDPLIPLPDTTTELEWPSTLNLGLALKPSDKVTLAADFGRTDWSKMLFNAGVQTGKVNFFDLEPQVSTRVSPAYDWRVGAEYLFFHRSVIIPVRGGWFYEPQPGIDAVTGKRFVNKGYTAGVGVKIGSVAVDFAYQRKNSDTPITLFEPDDLVIGDRNNPAEGRLQRSENRMFVSMILQLPRSLGRLIPAIFVEPEKSPIENK